jgi:hypothetical protein
MNGTAAQFKGDTQFKGDILLYAAFGHKVECPLIPKRVLVRARSASEGVLLFRDVESSLARVRPGESCLRPTSGSEKTDSVR